MIPVKDTATRHSGDILCAPITGNVLGSMFGFQTRVSCQQQKAAMLVLTEEEKPQALKEILNMLKRTKAHKQQ